MAQQSGDTNGGKQSGEEPAGDVVETVDPVQAEDKVANDESQDHNPSSTETLIPTLDQNVDGSAGTQIESLCMYCHKQGTTRILLTNIPFFREVAVLAFDCEHCGYRDNELQSCGEIAEFGVEVGASIEEASDLQRSLLLSDSAEVSIPEIGLEIPSAKKGRLTTVEGVLSEVTESLSLDLNERRREQPELFIKLTEFLAHLARLKMGDEKFRLVVRDISGNSAIDDNPFPERVKSKTFVRSNDENEALGITAAEGAETNAETEARPTQQDGSTTDARDDDAVGTEEVMVVRDDCPACGKNGENRIKLQHIPYFKDVVIMAFSCDFCGYKSTETRPSSNISEKGRRTTLKITSSEDLTRDLLKSDTASLEVPEVELSLEPGTLGGTFTTVEGVLTRVKENLLGVRRFVIGDSAPAEQRKHYSDFFASMDELLSGKREFTLILDDCAGNSYIQNLYAPDPDPNMEVVEYVRDAEQNERLGLESNAEEDHEEAT